MVAAPSTATELLSDRWPRHRTGLFSWYYYFGKKYFSALQRPRHIGDPKALELGTGQQRPIQDVLQRSRPQPKIPLCYTHPIDDRRHQGPGALERSHRS